MTALFKSRVTFTGGTGGTGVSTMFFSTASGATAQDASDAHGDYFSRFKTHISSSIQITIDPQVVEVESTTGETTGAYGVTNRTFAGEDGADMLPWQTQGLVRFLTPRWINGRRLTGRSFMPGPTEASNTNGVPNAGYLAALDSTAVLLQADTAPILIVYSPTHHAFSDTNGVSIPTRWASLRSRRD